MRISLFVSLVTFCAATGGPPAHAAADPEAVAGLIAENCASRHRVPGHEARLKSVDLNAPAFDEIAKDPGAYPPERMRTFLQRPHWPMAQFVLSPTDIDNILAFIAALR